MFLNVCEGPASKTDSSDAHPRSGRAVRPRVAVRKVANVSKVSKVAKVCKVCKAHRLDSPVSAMTVETVMVCGAAGRTPQPGPHPPSFHFAPAFRRSNVPVTARYRYERRRQPQSLNALPRHLACGRMVFCTECRRGMGPRGTAARLRGEDVGACDQAAVRLARRRGDLG
jgi:hypothetical protein